MVTSHDQNFKNQILDYPEERQVMAGFAESYRHGLWQVGVYPSFQ